MKHLLRDTPTPQGETNSAHPGQSRKTLHDKSETVPITKRLIAH